MNFNTELRKKIKFNSKRALSHSWASALVILFLLLSIEILFSIISTLSGYILGINGVFDILNTPDIFFDDLPDIGYMAIIFNFILMVGYIMVTAPLKIGQHFWYYNLTVGIQDDVTSIFVCFSSIKKFFRALFLKVNIYIRKLFWCIILYSLPCLALSAGIVTLNMYDGSSNQEAMIGSILIFCGITLFGLFTIIASIIFQKYFLAPYYLSDDSLSVRKSISLSIKATKGEKTIIFLFKLSFIGWHILNIFIIPLLYTQPYIQTSRAMYARYLITLYTQKTAVTNLNMNIKINPSITD